MTAYVRYAIRVIGQERDGCPLFLRQPFSTKRGGSRGHKRRIMKLMVGSTGCRKFNTQKEAQVVIDAIADQNPSIAEGLEVAVLGMGDFAKVPKRYNKYRLLGANRPSTDEADSFR